MGPYLCGVEAGNLPRYADDLILFTKTSFALN